MYKAQELQKLENYREKKPKSTTLLKMTESSRKKLGERTDNICPF